MYKKILISLSYFIFISIFMCILNLHNKNIVQKITLLILTSIFFINDNIRRFKLYKNNRSCLYNFSLFFSILGCSILRYLLMEAEVIPYIISILLEILELEGTQLIIFFDIHLLFFIILLLNNIGVPNSFTKVSYFANILLGYLFIAYIAYSVNIVKREKEKVTTLNTKLRQYALEVEELTISKERTLLAQELHDSLGHSLTALYMHLEFAKNICDRNPDEVKDLIIKSEELTKSSIDSLRESVYLLKHSNKIESFEKSIQSLINNFNNINNLKFNLNTSGNLDSLNSVIKNSMYQTIKESITNSIKHGKATKINIDILLDNNKLSINLNDNGIGCTNIIKSNGLLGIEDRVHSLNGSVNYLHGTTVPGFFIEICIPNIMEEIINDKCNSS